MQDLKISKKKPSFPITHKLNQYLSDYNRNVKIPIFYDVGCIITSLKEMK